MNTWGLNSGSLNGGGYALRVVAASALGLTALSANAYGLRITGGQAYGDAVAAVTLTGKHQIAGKAVATGESLGVLLPTITRSGGAYALVSSFGNGAVLRLVDASAAADSGVTGEALAADVLGESLAHVDTTGESLAHVIHPGRTNILCTADTSAQAVAIRMSPAIGLGGVIGFGESTIQRNGETFKRLDGYAYATSTATAVVRNDYTAIIATYGAFDFGRTTSGAAAFTRYSASANVWATTQVQAEAVRNVFAQATATAGCVGNSGFTGILPGKSLALAQSQATARATRVYQAKATRAVSSSSEATGRTRWGGKSVATAQASSAPVVRANHFFAQAAHTSVAIGDALAKLSSYGRVLQLATANGMATPAQNPKGSSLAEVVSTGLSGALVNMSGKATIQANATGVALGFSNVDVLAPLSRAMRVPAEYRLMDVTEEIRTMIVEA